MPETPAPDIDRILEAIRTEARQRGSRGAGPAVGLEGGGGSGAARESFGVAMLAPRHVADYLALPLDVFLVCAYRGALGREPDAAGAAHYQRALLRGAITRIEMLGRLSFSPESRRRGLSIPGLATAFAIALCYRIPLAGPALGVLARALRLPAHWQDRSGLEAAALASGAWMKR